MKTVLNNGGLTLFPQGRIDSSNAQQIETEMVTCVNDAQPDEVVVDAEQLTYISSAGLRVLLKLCKKCKDFRVINASADIYGILEMTGFTEIMKVEKAYRTLDVSGCEIVGEGGNGKIYRLDSDTILKVYKNATIEHIKRETELSRTAFILGVPTAIPFDVVKVGDTYGSVFELLSAKSFAELLRDDTSRLNFIAEKTVELARALHSTVAPVNLPRQIDMTREWLNEAKGVFDDEHFDKLCALLEAIPEPGTMLHGDLHIKNIMLHGDEALLIDMDTLCTGHPIYEMAFIYNAYEGFGICDKGVITRFLGVDSDVAAKLLHRILALYLDTEDDERINEVKEKTSVIGLLRVLRRVIRIGEQDTPEGSQLIAACRDRINSLIEKYDTLTYELPIVG